ncbi:MAG: thiosulfate oxidation carrier protein SoxY [Candidatus Thiothrix sulfatifontis]|nr:MAG: thiosulfate oxidation carrier protein SoxY [Candidatus Thiothrix sulfatifontis]
MKRRTFLQGTLAASAAGLAVSAGLLTPRMVMAEGGAFDAKTMEDALKTMALTPEDSADIKIKAPEIAENGAVVPVTVTSGVAGTTEISILVDGNPTPLAATFIMGEGTQPEASTRIKMGKTANVVAIAKAGDKSYTAKQEVKVTIGGCGG